MHQVSLLTTLVFSLGFGLALGLLAHKLKLPALVGYLLAGLLVGPATPGVVADLALSSQLAELGIILLMFGVGLHFSPKDLLAVKKIAFPGAMIGICILTCLGSLLGHFWNWPLGQSLVFGLSLSVASTVVLLRSLEARGQLKSINGQIAVGWLLVEDLVMVVLLVLLPTLSTVMAPHTNSGANFSIGSFIITVLIVLFKISFFIAFMLLVGRKVFPWLLWQVAKTGSRELFTLSVIAVALGIAYGSSKLFGVSFSLGAFFAGLIMRESHLSHRAAEESLPLRDAFSVLFFVSVGMLFDPHILIEYPIRVLLVVMLIILGKALVATTMVLIYRYPLNTALTVAAGLSQIGEFSFILTGLGVTLGLLTIEGQNLVLAAAIFTISFNHITFLAVEPIHKWLRRHSRRARRLEHPFDPLAQLPQGVKSRDVTGHVVLVGYGRVGSQIGKELQSQNLSFVIAEQNRALVEELRLEGYRAVVGDAADPAVLIQAHISRAQVIVIAIDDMVAIRRIIQTTRMVQPKARILVRSHSLEDMELLNQEKMVEAVWMERELAFSLINRTCEILQKEPHRDIQ